MTSESTPKRLAFSIENILSENNSKWHKPTYSPYDRTCVSEQSHLYETESLEEISAGFENGKDIPVHLLSFLFVHLMLLICFPIHKVLQFFSVEYRSHISKENSITRNCKVGYLCLP